MGSTDEIRRQRVRRLVVEVLPPLLHRRTTPLEVSALFVKGEPIAPAEGLAGAYEPFGVGQPLGGPWSTTWLRFTGRVPSDWRGESVAALIDLGYHALVGFGAEGLVFSGGRPVQGLNFLHDTITVASPAEGGEPVELHVEAAANPYVPWGGVTWPLLAPDYGGEPVCRLERADLAAVDTELLEAYHDLSVLFELASAVGLGDPRCSEILVALDRACLSVDHTDVRASLLAARPLWQGLLEDSGAPKSAPPSSKAPPSSTHVVTAVGHAHIDTAWLWPVRETRRKCARTFATALRLIGEHPDYVFCCSQAAQHAFVEEDHPELFARMVAAVASGRFEPVGSMWVEPDTNLPSGESLVRQLVYGKRYFLERYGVETSECFLPDAFGFSGNLPQILASAGVKRFLTQKLSWNEVDRFPHHSFWWEGIDGTRVLAHFPPADTYNGQMVASELLHGVRSFAEHGHSGRSLYLYGHGDGGGGPSEAMLARYRRLRALPARLGIGAEIELGTVGAFFGALEGEIEASERLTDATGAAAGTVATAHAGGRGGLPVWVGELYLEHHRAVQTTAARVKRGNRRCEELLREAELWLAAEGSGSAASGSGAGASYPRDELEGLWKKLLLHQFHDILPGSGIHWVAEDGEAAHEEIGAAAGALTAGACSRIARRIGARGGSIVCFNATSHARAGIVEIELPDGAEHEAVAIATGGSSGAVSPCSPLQRGTGGRAIFVAEVPGCGWSTYELTGAPHASAAPPDPANARPDAATGGIWLDNGLVSVHVDGNGHLSSILDHRLGRDLLPPGERGNVLQLHDDFPNDSDAWDVSLGAFERATEIAGLDSLDIVESGPVRARVRVSRSFGGSMITQDISLVAGSARVEVACEVDWHERHKFLKVAFPVAVHAASASYEIAFGHLSRPTHSNTSWDAARFEVPAHRWADLSEAGFGVALLNDCKYGYDVRSNVLRLSLLRGPTWPDPEADQGGHRFSYAILGHRGLAVDAMTVTDEAEALNMAIRPVLRPEPQPSEAPVGLPPSEAGPVLPAECSVVGCEGAMVSCVKRADGYDGIVLRIFEPTGGRSRVAIRSDLFALQGALPLDVLERSLSKLSRPSPLSPPEAPPPPECAEVPAPPPQPAGAIHADDAGEIHLSLRAFELTTLRLEERHSVADAS